MPTLLLSASLAVLAALMHRAARACDEMLMRSFARLATMGAVIAAVGAAAAFVVWAKGI